VSAPASHPPATLSQPAEWYNTNSYGGSSSRVQDVEEQLRAMGRGRAPTYDVGGEWVQQTYPRSLLRLLPSPCLISTQAHSPSAPLCSAHTIILPDPAAPEPITRAK
jgi:hypothetical protein